jgi:hypothetical protein
MSPNASDDPVPPPGDPRDAARAVVDAKLRLARARQRLAAAPVRDTPAVIVDPEWADFETALQENAPWLRSLPGVVGYGLATRVKDGLDTGEPCVAVYVGRKRSPRGLARRKETVLPRVLEAPGGAQVPLDVVQVGRLRRRLLCGTGLGHPPGPQQGNVATLGLVARDDLTGEPVALTAMHLTGLEEFPPGDELSFVCPEVAVSGSRALGRLLQGTMRGVDAAKISITPPLVVERFVRGIGPIAGTRVLSHPGDRNTPVQLFGARSGFRQGVIDTPRTSLPEFGLEEAFLVRIDCRGGDSGAAVLDMDRHVLGLLVGELSDRPGVHAVSPIGPVLLALNCTF